MLCLVPVGPYHPPPPPPTIAHTDQTIHQVVAYKWLNTKSGRGRLQEVVGFFCKALTGKILVIRISVRLCAYWRWSLTRGGHTWRLECIEVKYT